MFVCVYMCVCMRVCVGVCVRVCVCVRACMRACVLGEVDPLIPQDHSVQGISRTDSMLVAQVLGSVLVLGWASTLKGLPILPAPLYPTQENFDLGRVSTKPGPHHKDFRGYNVVPLLS